MRRTGQLSNQSVSVLRQLLNGDKASADILISSVARHVIVVDLELRGLIKIYKETVEPVGSRPARTMLSITDVGKLALTERW